MRRHKFGGWSETAGKTKPAVMRPLYNKRGNLKYPGFGGMDFEITPLLPHTSLLGANKNY
jgi:hypothetical protein